MSGCRTSWTNSFRAVFHFLANVFVLFDLCCKISFLCPSWKLRLDWFVHENVPGFPRDYLMDTLGPAGYDCQMTIISPQRFGKPMSRIGQNGKTKKMISTRFQHAGLASTGSFSSEINSHGWAHHFVRFSSWWPRTNLWSYQLMTCISWARKRLQLGRNLVNWTF